MSDLLRLGTTANAVAIKLDATYISREKALLKLGRTSGREDDPNWYGTCSITNYEYTKQTLLRCWALLSLVVIRDALKNVTEDRVMKRLSLVAVFLLIISPAFADSIGLVVTDLTISHRLPTGSVFVVGRLPTC
jgi:hypothetical protein